MKNYTDTTIVLDRSGSMASIRDDMIGGFNTFIEKAKKDNPQDRITLRQFDNQHDVVFENIAVTEVQPLTKETYVPRADTALRDAIGMAIVATGERLNKLKEEDKPERVCCLIITDGHENASKEYNQSRIAEMIKHQREKYNWQFVFLGANQDAIETGKGMEVKTSSSLTFDASMVGVQNAFASVSGSYKRYSGGATMDCSFEESDREIQNKLLNSNTKNNSMGAK